MLLCISLRNHSCYNSYEVGQRLALTMLSKLDPTADPWTEPTHNVDPDLLPSYTQYKAVAANLPGRLENILLFRRDGEYLPLL